eukprot:maker-scaffold353_size198981-snap-gene-0.35 protein:Tk05250 transcript:maker-scaffold353_size198981-snap-gene-0.35-mRNA-1 annotation:"yth domain-containing protein 1"
MSTARSLPAAEPEEGDDSTGGQPVEENILDDLLEQSHEHETMFDDDDDPGKKVEESQGGGAEGGEDISDDEFAPEDEAEPSSPRAETNHPLSDAHSDISDCDIDQSMNPSPTGASGAEVDLSLTRSPYDAVTTASPIDSGPEEQVSPLKSSADRDCARSVADEGELPSPDTRTKRPREKIEAPAADQDEDEASSDVPAARERSPVPRALNRVETGKKTAGGKSYDYATKLNYLFRDARVFLVKSNNAENVSLSKAKAVWSTPPANESRFNQAFEESRNVLLVFSVKESGRFAGFARMASPSRRDVPSVSWVLPPGLSAKALGGVFHIDWVCRKELSFQRVQHLSNPWNDDKPVKIGRDGQEIQPSVALELCRLFVEDASIDMTPILRKSKESARKQRSQSVQERERAVPKTQPLGSNRGGTFPPLRPEHLSASRHASNHVARKRYSDDRGPRHGAKMARSHSSSSRPSPSYYEPPHYSRVGGQSESHGNHYDREYAESRRSAPWQNEGSHRVGGTSSVLQGANGPRTSRYVVSSDSSNRSYYSSMGSRLDYSRMEGRREIQHLPRGSRTGGGDSRAYHDPKSNRKIYSRRLLARNPDT